MIDNHRRDERREEKERVRRRIHVTVDPSKHDYYPEKKQADFYDDDVHQRVAIYVRVSTDDIKQTTSYELQKKYYEEFVIKHPNWELVEIYADEGISGTSRKHRDAFNRMVTDCHAGKADMIVCKSVSRFARNVEDCIGIVRQLAALNPPVGVFFESECIFSLKDESQMGLSFQAIMAEEESHTRSRSMEASLRMRLDNGIPLTPKLLGYTHDSEGNLIINPDEAPTVKLAFYMYLYGYSTQQIADTFNFIGKRSYLGNTNWTSSGISQILRNERHCGDVFTRKTYTIDYRSHKKRVNRDGQRPQSRYRDHHEAIVSRDDFIAVQRLLDNAKYKNKSILPELMVIDSGILKGFVVLNPRWGAFSAEDYLRASMSVYPQLEETERPASSGGKEVQVEAEAGSFDLRGFEIARSELFDSRSHPSVSFYDRKVKFSGSCVERFGKQNFVELLINPVTKMFAVRPAERDNRSGVVISRYQDGKFRPRDIPAAAFSDKLYTLFGWSIDRKYRITGCLCKKDEELAFIFEAGDSETFFKPFMIDRGDDAGQPLTPSGKRIRAVPVEWTQSFGQQFYLHERSFSALAEQRKEDWALLLKGELFDSGKRLKVTDFEVLKDYIQSQIGDIPLSEVELTHG